jgi:4-hydroxy-tetrahydrodipicolinate synthase
LDELNSAFAVHGLWCAMLTPLDSSGGVDHGLMVAHARSLLDRGVDGVAPFGTTGEGQSFSLAERLAGVDALLAAGIPGVRVAAATGCAALPETIVLTRHGMQAGCAACLVLPPFFWKDATDDGLFAWYANVIEAVGDPRLRIYLYHIPQISGTPLSVDLIARLAAAYPGIIAGVKDSAGDWTNTQALLARVPRLAILVGHEPHLPRLMRAGGAGTICGVANLFPALVRALLSPNVTPEDEQRVISFIEIAFRQPFLAGFKAILAEQTRNPGWRAVRAPLLPLAAQSRNALLTALREVGLIAPGQDPWKAESR